MSRHGDGASRNEMDSSMMAKVQAMVDNSLATLKTRVNDLETRCDAMELSYRRVRNSNAELKAENTRLRRELDSTRKSLHAAVIKQEDMERRVGGSSRHSGPKEELDDDLDWRVLEGLDYSYTMGVQLSMKAKDEETNVDLGQASSPRAFLASNDSSDAGSDTEENASLPNVNQHSNARSSLNSASDESARRHIFDPKLFLDGEVLHNRPSAEPSTPRYPYSTFNDIFGRLKASAYNDYGRLHFNKTTSIWSPTADRCLYFFPHQRYDATSQTFSDALCGSMARGEIRECFLGRDEGTWSYCGTFECTGVSYMYYGDFIAFQRDRPGLVERIMSKTLLNCPAEVGEHHRERILRDDELVVGCCGLVKTGHDVDIERALGAHSQASSPHALKRTSSESQSGSRKMQRQSTTSSDGRA